MTYDPFTFMIFMLLALVVAFGATFSGLEVWEFFTYRKRVNK